jgi:hypothetical protein
MNTIPKAKQKWQSIHDVNRRIIIIDVTGRWATIRDVGRGKQNTQRRVTVNDIIDDFTKVCKQ